MFTSRVEVQNVSKFGVWIYADGKEYFLSFEHYPWFKKAKVSSVYKVKKVFECHLYWPDIDVDLELGSLNRPEEYPLVYKRSRE